MHIPTDGPEIKGGREPYMKLYVDDWLAGTRGLSYELQGFYMQLLCLMWGRKGGLPNDADALAEHLDKDRRKVRRLLAELLAKSKLIVVGDQLINPRIQRDILKRQLGAKSGRPRGKVLGEVGEKSGQSLGEVSETPGRKLGSDVTKSKGCKPLPDPDPDPLPEKIAAALESVAPREAAAARPQIDLIDLGRRLTEAAGDALANPAAAPGLLNLATPASWLEQGCDLELDVLPAVREVAARSRKGPIRSWVYFAQRVAETHHERTAPLPAVDAMAPRRKPAEPDWWNDLVLHGKLPPEAAAAVAAAEVAS
jgi:uncharacterized protein YdaU (DUF1376 family)